MGYPSYDLDDCDTPVLLAEYNRRLAKSNGGKCWYCDRELRSEPSCRKRTIHSRVLV